MTLDKAPQAILAPQAFRRMDTEALRYTGASRGALGFDSSQSEVDSLKLAVRWCRVSCALRPLRDLFAPFAPFAPFAFSAAGYL